MKESKQIFKLNSKLFKECFGCKKALGKGAEEAKDFLDGKNMSGDSVRLEVVIDCQDVDGKVFAKTELKLNERFNNGNSGKIKCPVME
jgi:hypothetical protein